MTMQQATSAGARLILQLHHIATPTATKSNSLMNGEKLTELLSKAEAQGIEVLYKPLPFPLCGVFYKPQNLIILDAALNECQMRCTLCHELIHAEYGDDGCTLRDKAETRTRRLTAATLITLPEYKQAEAIYSNNDYLIARELDVTLSVLKDFKSLCLLRY